MSTSLSRQGPSICQLCGFISRQSALRSSWKRSMVFTNHVRTFSTPGGSRPSPWTAINAKNQPSQPTDRQPPNGIVSTRHLSKPRGQGVSATSSGLQSIQQMVNVILSSKAPPSEEDIKYFLRYCEEYASKLLGTASTTAGLKVGTATSAILSLEDDTTDSSSHPTAQRQRTDQQSIQETVDTLSELAYKVLVHPTVFISLNILTAYVSLQTRLSNPFSFPEIFDLYATKPTPHPTKTPSSEIRYTTPNPSKASFAIPAPLASKALDCAVAQKSLPTALAIISTTYAAPSFRRAKIIRRALPSLTAFALVPVASYTVATRLADYQQTMDPATATNIAFAGIFAYVAFTATLGMVALTTANDQMVRVVWALGMPLRERWIREEERAALDRVAQAWGFKEEGRRGEEEGEDWEMLREWIGRRGMVLDKVELMEGME